MPRGFASDNAAPVHPTVLAALEAVNDGHALAYGHDPVTEAVTGRLAEMFGAAQAQLVFNGSGANLLVLRLVCRPWEAVICPASAHINTDETGAPEAIAGVKLLGVATPDGKLTPELVTGAIERVGDEHAVQPRLLSVSQSTELGTVYTPAELRALADLAHANGMLLHVDGARLANAAAALNASPAEVSTGAGADLVSFGATKNGCLGAEAVIIADPAVAEGVLYLRKQSPQLASKMRYLAAQFDAYLTDELWRATAGHANAMAARLAASIGDIAGVQITYPVQANVVFAALPAPMIAPLQERHPFYVWDEHTHVVRLMCAWDTTESDVDALADSVRELAGAAAAQ